MDNSFSAHVITSSIEEKPSESEQALDSIFDNFVDIYIYPYNKQSSFVYVPNVTLIYRPNLDQDAPRTRFEQLVDNIVQEYTDNIQNHKVDYRFTSQLDERNYRCHLSPSVNGYMINARRQPLEVWPLYSCFRALAINERKAIVDQITSPRLCKGGLIIVAGTPGNGKTTTLAAIIRERLIRFGGHCITVEDPVEMPLHGPIGDTGYCVQREVDASGDFAPAVRDSLRGYPTNVNNLLLIGEVRDAQTAELAVRSANDGRLVLITVHAESLIAAITALLAHLSNSRVNNSQAKVLLSQSIRLAIHQVIDNKNNLHVDWLVDTNAIATGIEQAKNNVITDEIAAIRKQVELGRPIETRKIIASSYYDKEVQSDTSQPPKAVVNRRSKTIKAPEQHVSPQRQRHDDQNNPDNEAKPKSNTKTKLWPFGHNK